MRLWKFFFKEPWDIGDSFPYDLRKLDVLDATLVLLLAWTKKQCTQYEYHIDLFS
jgi:hypothetical protein